LSSFLKRVRSAMSRTVVGRAFHASVPEKENARLLLIIINYY